MLGKMYGKGQSITELFVIAYFSTRACASDLIISKDGESEFLGGVDCNIPGSAENIFLLWIGPQFLYS